jgi:hypothetical protein
MNLTAGLAKLRIEIAELENAIGEANPSPLLVLVHGDPERRGPGPDEATIYGVRYLRLDGEDRE